MVTAVRLADLMAAMDAAYPPKLAESWDSVGLVCGDPEDAVSRVLFAVDATAAVVDEAIAWGAQALVVHHPLLLRGVDTVAADTPKGRCCTASSGPDARCSPRTPMPIPPTRASRMRWRRPSG
ncbi:hypothetical protein Ntsu_55680 [Nocardia sp. IFM 10818]